MNRCQSQSFRLQFQSSLEKQLIPSAFWTKNCSVRKFPPPPFLPLITPANNSATLTKTASSVKTTTSFQMTTKQVRMTGLMKKRSLIIASRVVVNNIEMKNKNN